MALKKIANGNHADLHLHPSRWRTLLYSRSPRHCRVAFNDDPPLMTPYFPIRLSFSSIGASLILAILRCMSPAWLNSHSSTPYERFHCPAASCHSYSKLTAI